ncbi:PKD domain-containing protein [Thioclava sp. BHET1]|nr:PKD domain-containing protein [Thioclava sp. BHET1]
MNDVTQNGTGGLRALGRALGGCLLALSLAGPVQARDWVVQGPAALSALSARVSAGDVLDLAPGNYPELVLYKVSGRADAPITVRSQDPANPARIARMNLRETSHIVLSNLYFDYRYTANDDPSLRPFQVFTTRDLTIRNSVFDGDMAPAGADAIERGPRPTAFGLAVRASNGVRIENNEIRRFFRGLVVSDTVNIDVRGNDLHDMRMDGMNFAQVERVKISHNTIHDFLRAANAGDHADMIQFWTAGTTRPSRDIEISNNILNSGEGLFTQSILMRNELVDRGKAGPEMFYRNITIRDNVIINAHLHGITVGETDGVTIANNTLIRNRFSQGDSADPKLWIPSIRVARSARDVRIEKNVVGEIVGPVGQPGWSVEGNLLIQDLSPERPNYYDTLFVAARTGLPDDLSNFDYLPNGPLAGAGVGAPLLDRLSGVATAFQPVMRVKTTPESGMGFAFDAGQTVLPAGVDPAQVRYTWQIGKVAPQEGAHLTMSFQQPGTYRVALTATLPDGQSRTALGQIAVRDGRVLTFDPKIGRLISHVGAEPTALSTIPLSPGGLEFGLGGGSIQVPPAMIAPFFGAEKFTLTMRLRALGDYKSAGEIARVHQSLIIKATGRGTLTVEFWPANGQRLFLRTRRIPLYDGKWHDLSFAYDSAAHHFEVRAEGKVIGEGTVSGETRPMEYWGLSLGYPFGNQASFHGEIEALELDALGPAVAGVL